MPENTNAKEKLPFKLPVWKIVIILFTIILDVIFLIVAAYIGMNSIWQLIVMLISTTLVVSLLVPDLRKELEAKQEKVLPDPKKMFGGMIGTGGLAIIILLTILWLVYLIFSDVLSTLLGASQAIIFLLLVFLAFVYIVTLLAPIYYWHLWRKSLGKPVIMRHWIYSTIASMIIFVFLGVVFIGLATQASSNTLISFGMSLDDTDQGFDKGFGIACDHGNRPILAGQRLTCEYWNQSIDVFNASVEYHLENGITRTEEIVNMEIYPPKDLSHIKFKITVYNENGELIEVTNGADSHFSSREEIRTYKTRIENYLLGLLAIAFFTIPLAVKNLKDLWN